MTKYISIDAETFLAGKDYPEPYGFQGQAPLNVCWAYAQEARSGLFHAQFAYDTCRDLWLKALRSQLTIVGQNIAFDMGVAMKHLDIPLGWVLDKYNRGQVRDTMVREVLLQTASGEMAVAGKKGIKTDLATLTLKYLDKDVSADKGPDAWRMRYAELYDVPIADWETEAREYPIQDVEDTLAIFHKQGEDTISPDEINQTRSAFDLQLISLWSPNVNGDNAEMFLMDHEHELAKAKFNMQVKGILRENGTLDKKKLQRYVELDYESQGIPCPRTEHKTNPQIQVSKDALLGCKTPLLREWGEAQQSKKIMESFAPSLRKASGRQIQTRYNVLVSTGRTSSFGEANMQQQSKATGHRECFEPVDINNNVLVNMDFDSFELFGLAQTCLLYTSPSPRDATLSRMPSSA